MGIGKFPVGHVTCSFQALLCNEKKGGATRAESLAHKVRRIVCGLE